MLARVLEALAQRIDSQDPEHDGSQPSRPEPTDERNGRKRQPAADQCDRDRDHSDNRQAEDRVEDGPQIAAAPEERTDERRTKDRPHRDRQEDPGHLAEELRPLLGMSCHGAEGQSSDESRDKPIAAEAHGREVAAEGQGKHGDLARQS